MRHGRILRSGRPPDLNIHLPRREGGSTSYARPCKETRRPPDQVTVARIHPAVLWKSTTALPGWTSTSTRGAGVVVEAATEHRQRVVELLDRARPDDRRGHARLLLDPEQRELRGRQPALPRQLGDGRARPPARLPSPDQRVSGRRGARALRQPVDGVVATAEHSPADR